MHWYLRTIVAAAFAVAAVPALAHTGQGVSGGFSDGVHASDRRGRSLAGDDRCRRLGCVLRTAFDLGFTLGISADDGGGIRGRDRSSASTQRRACNCGIRIGAWRSNCGGVARADGHRGHSCCSVRVFSRICARARHLPVANNAASYVAGFVVATGLIHLAGIAFGHLMQAPGRALAFRVSGAAIALAGAWITAGVLGVA